MSLNGYVYRITGAEVFFLPILLGAGPDGQGYASWSGVQVRAQLIVDVGPFFLPLPVGTATTNADGAFSIADLPPALVSAFGGPSNVRVFLQAFLASPPYSPLYRSDLDLTVAEAEKTELNIWLFPDTLPESDGVTAGTVTSVLGRAGLPGNTTITASPSGLAFSGSDSGANIEFGVSITPDTSSDLDSFVDLALASWNISVGWPADWCKTADDIFAEIGNGLQGAGSSMNAAVLAKMKTVFEQQDHVSASDTDTFFGSDVSVTFMDVKYPTPYSWPLWVEVNKPTKPRRGQSPHSGVSQTFDLNTGDGTVVVTADPCIGFPRHLTSDPPKPEINLVRFSELLRPVLV